MNNFCKICSGKAKTWLEFFPENAKAANMEQQGNNVVMDEREPYPGEIRWVRCKDYRCMGMLDKDGHWRSFMTGAELTDVVEVIAE